MKKLLLFVLVALSINCVAQEKETAFEVYQKYITDCNEIVLDTVIENGAVKMEYLPFKMEGKDCLMLTPVDTIWNESDCRDYKYVNYRDNIWTGESRLVISTGGGYAVNTSSQFSYGNKTISQMSENITREKICKIKKRKPSFTDFWDRWCVENGYVKQ